MAVAFIHCIILSGLSAGLVFEAVIEGGIFEASGLGDHRRVEKT